jgi:hypothetical protein
MAWLPALSQQASPQKIEGAGFIRVLFHAPLIEARKNLNHDV